MTPGKTPLDRAVHAQQTSACIQRQVQALRTLYPTAVPVVLPLSCRVRKKGRLKSLSSNGARSGLTGFVAGLARQPKIASRNVTINALLPGPFDTDRLRTTMAGAAAKSGKPIEALMDERRALNPTRRFGTPAEFGAACAFLCSVHAGYITGQNLLLDGGAYPGTF